MRAPIRAFVAALLAAAAPAARSDDPPRAVRIAVPALGGSEAGVRNRWQPVADHLGATVPGVAFRVDPLAPDAFRSAVDRGDVDLVLADAATCAGIEHRLGGIRLAALARPGCGGDESDRESAVLFARSDRDDLLEIATLRGRAVAAVDPESFEGWRMAWRELVRAGIDPSADLALRFTGSPEAVVDAVLGRIADAGTVPAGVLERLAAEGRLVPEEIRILGDRTGDDPAAWRRSTPLYPGWAMAALSHAPPGLGRRVAASLLLAPPGSPAALAAGGAGWTVPPDDTDVHACLQAIGLQPATGGEPAAAGGRALFGLGALLLAGALATAGLAARCALRRKRDVDRERGARRAAESDRDRLADRAAAMETLARLADDGTPWPAVLERAAALAAAGAGADRAGLFRLLPGSSALFLEAGTGWMQGRVGRSMVEANHDSLPGAALLHDRPVRVDDAGTGGGPGATGLLGEHRTLSGVSVPVPGYGVLGVYAERRKAFGKDDETWLRSLALLLAAVRGCCGAGVAHPGADSAVRAPAVPETGRTPRMTDLLPQYMARRREDVTRLRDALRQGDFETIARLGRDMQGTGRGYGVAAIAGIGGDLARAADGRDDAAARRAVDALAALLPCGTVPECVG
jgi:ABC-type phosphate/phosphonate transport system substrate-binding protein